MRYAIIIAILLSGCGNVFHPRLPGPAEDVSCIITRTSGALIGEYECEIKGKYELKDTF